MPQSPPLRPKRVKTAVMRHFQLTEQQMDTFTRKREIVYPRQISMFIMAYEMNIPLKRIAQMFSHDYTHSTVWFAREQVRNLLCTDEETREHMRKIYRRLSLEFRWKN